MHCEFLFARPLLDSLFPRTSRTGASINTARWGVREMAERSRRLAGRDGFDDLARSPMSSHVQTGLTQACMESKYTMEEVDELVTSYITQHFPPGSKWRLVLC